MSKIEPKILRGIARVEGSAEGEALVTSEKLSHLFNAVSTDGVIRMHGHSLSGQSYAGKIVVYSTDIFSTGGALGLFFKARIANTGPKALICRTVHPISLGGAVDAGIPAIDGFEADPCTEIATGDWVKITAPKAGGEALVEVYPKEGEAPVKGAQQIGGRAKRSKRIKKGETSGLFLTPYEREMLDGKHGKAKQLAMERLVKFGCAVGAKRMSKIRSAHIFSDWEHPYYAMGAWPLYKEFAALGAKVAIPTTLQSSSIADDLIDDEGMPWHYKVFMPARDGYPFLKIVNDILRSMGVHIIPTCIPYMHLSIPRIGECHVWCESNAAAYGNAMLGARINRDPGNMAFYSALTGVLPEYGVHLDANRRGQMLFEVDPALASELTDVADYVALGGAVGFKASDKVPVVVGLEHMTNEQAKGFCACVSPALTYPMLHIVGITPEAPTVEAAFGGKVPKGLERIRIGRAEVATIFRSIHQTDKLDVDAAVVGCPFLTVEELVELADMLAGRKVRKPLWLHTDYVICAVAKKTGLLGKIESSGARVVHSMCPGMVARDDSASELVFATDSLKAAMLLAGIGHPKWWFGTRKDVVNAAINGKFERTRWA